MLMPIILSFIHHQNIYIYMPEKLSPIMIEIDKCTPPLVPFPFPLSWPAPPF